MPREIDLKEPFWFVVSKNNVDDFLSRVEKDIKKQIKKPNLKDFGLKIGNENFKIYFEWKKPKFRTCYFEMKNQVILVLATPKRNLKRQVREQSNLSI